MRPRHFISSLALVATVLLQVCQAQWYYSNATLEFGEIIGQIAQEYTVTITWTVKNASADFPFDLALAWEDYGITWSERLASGLKPSSGNQSVQIPSDIDVPYIFWLEAVFNGSAEDSSSNTFPILY